jgi:hypothetical protein
VLTNRTRPRAKGGGRKKIPGLDRGAGDLLAPPWLAPLAEQRRRIGPYRYV